MVGLELERNIREAWLELRARILSDPQELRRRVAGRRLKSLNRPPSGNFRRRADEVWGGAWEFVARMVPEGFEQGVRRRAVFRRMDGVKGWQTGARDKGRGTGDEGENSELRIQNSEEGNHHAEFC